MRPDGIIRSVHFVPIQHPEKGADWLWPFDNEEFSGLSEVVGAEKLWELYIARLLDDLEKLPAHIVGDFYAPAAFGRWPVQKKLEEYEDRMLDVAHRRGFGVEISTRFLYREQTDERKKKYLDANARLVRKAKARGVGIAIGSDAHSPKDQGNGFDVILRLLDDARINEVVFPVAGRLARVALRATREHLEADAQARRQSSAPGSSITGYSRAELGLPEELEAATRAGGRASRETGPKKRAGDSSRTSKRPASQAPPSASTSRRSEDSSSSASKAKAARVAKPASAPKKKKKAVEPPPPKRAAAAKKPSAKREPARKKKPAAKKSSVKKSPAKKAPVKTPTAKKQRAVKKPAAKKAASRKAAKAMRPKAGFAKKSVKKKKPAAKRR